MKRKLLYISMAIVLILAIGCQKQDIKPEETESKSPEKENVESVEAIDVKFSYQDGVTALTAAKLAKETPAIDENITIDYDMQNSPDLLVAKVLKEEADIAIVPSNLAAQAFNKGLPYKVVGTPTWGSMYLTSTEDIKSFEDLKGKEIYTFGKGLTPDIVLRYILSKNDIDPDTDVKIVYLNSAAEMGPAFLGGKTNLAVLPEPLFTAVTAKNEEAKAIFDLNEEWGKVSNAKKGFPQSTLIIKEDLIENNKAFVENFIKEYDNSRKWAIANLVELGDYSEELGISVEKGIINKGIRWTNPEEFNIEEGIVEYETYYKAILDFAPDFIGGKLPSEELYFKR